MTMDRPLREAIDAFDWYQRIPLGDGSFTPGRDTHTQAKLPLLELPESLAGASLLDVGCSEGFFAFEAERRGAERVVGVDNDEANHEKALLLKAAFGSAVDFQRLEVHGLSRRKLGRFDWVLFLSVLNQLPYPFLALRRIARLTRGTAVMEIHVAVPDGSGGEDEDPVIVRRRSRQGRSLLLPNRPMLLEMLERAGFDDVEEITSHRARPVPGYGNRYRQERLILKARRPTARAAAVLAAILLFAVPGLPASADPSLADPDFGTLELVTPDPTEQAKLKSIDGLAFDDLGNLFGALENTGPTGAVVYIDVDTGAVTVLATDISRADQIAFHPSGDFFVTSEVNPGATTDRLYRVSPIYDANDVPISATKVSLTTSDAIDNPEGLVVLEADGAFGNLGGLYVA